MASYFTPPTWVYNESHPGPASRLFSRMKWLHVGYGVMRDAAGGYTQSTDADDDDIKFSSAFYMGGRSYLISDQEVTDLTNAGYSQYITTA
jgi:hypothetical protein